MTATEFDDEFLLNYQYAGGNSAPGFNAYARSLFLSRAQEELVKDAYRQRSNSRLEGFEASETRRRQLSNLVKQEIILPGQAVPYNVNFNISPDSQIFNNLDLNKVLRIVSEHIDVDPAVCGKTQLPVYAITHDEYSSYVGDPFRKPTKDHAWRLDTGVFDDINNSLELITNVPYIRYVLRYIRRPRPIIVADLSNLSGVAYSIDGETSVQTSELIEGFHPEIVTRAVQNALEAVGDPRFQTHFIAKDNRIE